MFAFWQSLAATLSPPRPVPIVYDPAYRLPMTTAGARLGIETRRADFALWYLESRGWIAPGNLHPAPRIGYEELARVHTPEWLESLGQPEVLSQVFGIEPWDIPVDALMHTVRLACGGTLQAARLALAAGGPAMNFLGGFHHAAPGRGAGLCPVNDVAVAVATLRHEGFDGRIGILDLDAHPPDGTAACLGDSVWHGSLSGSDWGKLPGVLETVLPERATDDVYLAALDKLLAVMPERDLVFVLAGGDVMASDALGRLGMTLAGAAERDLRVAHLLHAIPSVWLPAGGYSAEAWRILAGTATVLMKGVVRRVPHRFDPLRDRFQRVSEAIRPERLGAPSDTELDLSDVEAELGLRRPPASRFLGYYTRDGIEYGLFRQGILTQLERLGYRDFRVEIDVAGPAPGDRMRLYGRFIDESEDRPPSNLLVESSLEKQMRPGIGGVLYVHWLTLRHPRSAFVGPRPALPGQDVPGLGLAREASELLGTIAFRLGLKGVVIRPAHFHVAYVARERFQFLDAAIQGRFDALVRDLRTEPAFLTPDGGFALARASRAVGAGHVFLSVPDGPVAFGPPTRFDWGADEYLRLLGESPKRPEWDAERAETAAHCRFVYRSPMD